MPPPCGVNSLCAPAPFRLVLAEPAIIFTEQWFLLCLPRPPDRRGALGLCRSSIESLSVWLKIYVRVFLLFQTEPFSFPDTPTPSPGRC